MTKDREIHVHLELAERRARVVVWAASQAAGPAAELRLAHVRLAPVGAQVQGVHLVDEAEGVGDGEEVTTDPTPGGLAQGIARWAASSGPSRTAAFLGAVAHDALHQHDVRGTEAVTLLLGPACVPDVALVCPETGPWRTFIAPSTGVPEVYRRSFADRWYCRVVLPPQWLPDPIDGVPLRIGVVRSHERSGDQESAPYALLPWRLDPGRFALDLGAW